MESNIQKQIINYIEANGGYVVKIIRCNKNGFPDLHFLMNGKTYYCEVKAPGKGPRALQEYRIEELIAHGGIAFFCDSLENFKNKLG